MTTPNKTNDGFQPLGKGFQPAQQQQQRGYQPAQQQPGSQPSGAVANQPLSGQVQTPVAPPKKP